MKKIKYLPLMVLLLFAVSLGFKQSTTEAGHADNPVLVNYTMANQVYSIPDSFTKGKMTKKGIMDRITRNINLQTQGNANATKYKVIDIISTNKNDSHVMGTLVNSNKISLDKAGLNAMAVVAPGSKKLWISIAGTKSNSDRLNALVAVAGKNRSGQEVQSMLYINYIHTAFPEYRDYKWYLTGHSLGGNLAVQTYMNVRAGVYLVPDKSKFKYGGAFLKPFSGVYVFNPLPVSRTKITAQQWNENLKGTYNSEVYNFVMDKEWLHFYKDASNYGRKVSDYRTNYIGTVGLFKSKNASEYKKAVNRYNKHLHIYKNWSDLGKIVADSGIYSDALHGRGELNSALSTKFYGADKQISY